jgi:hypothetical protein
MLVAMGIWPAHIRVPAKIYDLNLCLPHTNIIRLTNFILLHIRFCTFIMPATNLAGLQSGNEAFVAEFKDGDKPLPPALK